MRKTMSRRRVGQSDIELRLSCLAEQNFLNMPVLRARRNKTDFTPPRKGKERAEKNCLIFVSSARLSPCA